MAHHVLGLDYASQDENAVPDFRVAHAQGLRFVWLRGSVGTWRDPTPARDRAAIRAARIVYGAYLAPRIAAGAAPPAEQVAAFAAASDLQRGVDLAPAIDIEFSHGIAATGMTTAQIAAWLAQLIAAIRGAFGCSPIVYSSARVLEDQDTDTLHGAADTAIRDCPLWLTRYLSSQTAQYDSTTLDTVAAPRVPPFIDRDGWWIHQYQGDAHGFPTIKQADLNRFNTASGATQGTRRAWLLARLSAAGTATDAELDAAIRAFQAERHLVADGIVGPATFAALSWNR